MADKEFIISLLENVKRRLRSASRLKAISAVLAIALFFPLVFKIVDLISPLRGSTVVIFFAIWGAATAVFLGWRARGGETMSDAAARLDRQAGLHDQVKTAY